MSASTTPDGRSRRPRSTRHALAVVLVVVAESGIAGPGPGRRRASLRLFPCLLPAKGSQVEEVADEAEIVRAPGVRGVRVEDAVAVAEEDAQAVQIERLVPLADRHAGHLDLG